MEDWGGWWVERTQKQKKHTDSFFSLSLLFPLWPPSPTPSTRAGARALPCCMTGSAARPCCGRRCRAGEFCVRGWPPVPRPSKQSRVPAPSLPGLPRLPPLQSLPCCCACAGGGGNGWPAVPFPACRPSPSLLGRRPETLALRIPPLFLSLLPHLPRSLRPLPHLVHATCAWRDGAARQASTAHAREAPAPAPPFFRRCPLPPTPTSPSLLPHHQMGPHHRGRLLEAPPNSLPERAGEWRSEREGGAAAVDATAPCLTTLPPSPHTT